MLYLGSHVSLKAPDYFLGSIKEALSYGANACMIYTGPPSNTRRVDISKMKVQEAKSLMEENGMKMENIIVHAPYIINLANSMNPDTAKFGAEFLAQELKRVSYLGASYLVLHPGSHVKAGAEVGLQWIIDGLNEVLDQDDSNVCIALETMAGKGSECGRNFEELAIIKAGVHKSNRIGFCMDTCHIHDAGYDLTNFDSVLDEFDRILGLDSLKVLHINDSKNPIGAHKDRHENLGKGYIGFDILAQIVHHPRLDNLTKILETPYIDGKAPYKEEIEQLKAIKP